MNKNSWEETKEEFKNLEKLNNEVVKEVAQESLEESLANSTITTLEIAEMMGVEHYKILRKLEGDKNRKGYISILTDSQMGVSDYFIPSIYKDASGKENRCYLVTKLGCDFLANKFTGEKGVIFTAKYVKRFHEMEDALDAKIIPVLQQHMEQQAEFNRMIMERLDELGNGMSRCKENSYCAIEENTIESRKKEIYDLTSKVAELCGNSQTRILHYMYHTLEENLGIVLDSYKSVYRSETGRQDASMVEVIAANDKIYDAAVKMNQSVIERKKIYG